MRGFSLNWVELTNGRVIKVLSLTFQREGVRKIQFYFTFLFVRIGPNNFLLLSFLSNISHLSPLHTHLYVLGRNRRTACYVHALRSDSLSIILMYHHDHHRTLSSEDFQISSECMFVRVYHHVDGESLLHTSTQEMN